MPTFGQGAQATGALFSLYNGLNKGGISGDAGAATSGANLYNTFAGKGSQIPGVGVASNALGVYNGIKQGGVMGYGGAGINAMNLAQNAGLANFGNTVPVLGAALATYNAVKDYKSGKTGSDAMEGAEAGAAIGTAIVPGIGTLVGGIIGGAGGAIASAFGGGTTSQEGKLAQNYVGAFDKVPASAQAQMAASMTPSSNVQFLQGLMNAHVGSDGHQSDLQAAFGKNGVAGFTTGMTTQINSALAAGKIPANATPAQIYSAVVQPWLASKSGGQTSGNDVKGNSTSAAETAAITSMIGQWQSGALSSNTAVGVKGQKVTMPAWAGGGGPSQTPSYATSPSPFTGLAGISSPRGRDR